MNEEYKQLQSYQQLPANVQHAIDISKRKAKHSDFYMQLQDLTEKISVYKQLFCTKQPKFVQQYVMKRKHQMEMKLLKEQKELEDHIRQTNYKHHGRRHDSIHLDPNI